MNLSNRCGMIGTSVIGNRKSICLAPEDLEHKHDIYSLWSLDLPEYLVRHDLPMDQSFELVDKMPPIYGTCREKKWKHSEESHDGSLDHYYVAGVCISFSAIAFTPQPS